MNLYCVETKVNLLDKTKGDTFDFFICLIIPAETIKDAKNIVSNYNVLKGTGLKSIRDKSLDNFEINISQEFSEYGPSGKDGTYGQIKELSDRNGDIFGSGHQLDFITFTKLGESIYRMNLKGR